MNNPSLINMGKSPAEIFSFAFDIEQKDAIYHILISTVCILLPWLAQMYITSLVPEDERFFFKKKNLSILLLNSSIISYRNSALWPIQRKRFLDMWVIVNFLYKKRN